MVSSKLSNIFGGWTNDSGPCSLGDFRQLLLFRKKVSRRYQFGFVTWHWRQSANSPGRCIPRPFSKRPLAAAVSRSMVGLPGPDPKAWHSVQDLVPVA